MLVQICKVGNVINIGEETLLRNRRMNMKTVNLTTTAVMRETEQGWTLLELMFALVLLAVGVVSFMLALSSSMRLATASREKDLAVSGARRIIEEMRSSASFSSIFSTYDDHDFDVEGLKPRPGDADGHVGKVTIANSGSELHEDVTDADFGLPRDLNGDGSTDSNDHSGDYKILPVTVTIEWAGVAGDARFELKVLLAGY